MTPDPSAGAFVGAEHRLPVRVYYEDTDFSGLVYHARYLQFFERGRTDWLRVAGVRHADLLARPDPLVFAVRRMTIEFVVAARIDDALTVRTRFTAMKGARIAIAQRIDRGQDLIATADVEAVCLTDDGRARRPPRDLTDALAPRLDPDGGFS